MNASIDSQGVYKNLLDIVRVETFLTKVAELPNEKIEKLNGTFEELINHVNVLSNSLCHASWSDLNVVAGHLMRCISRFLGNQFSKLLTEYQERGWIVNAPLLKTKLDISLIVCIKEFFKRYLSTNFSQSFHHTPWTNELLQPLQPILQSIALHFESLKTRVPTTNATRNKIVEGKALNSDEEILIETLFETVTVVLISLFSLPLMPYDHLDSEIILRRHSLPLADSSINGELKEVMVSEVYAQYIHTCLIFLVHKSKAISLKAIYFLLILISTSSLNKQLTFWRRSFPGIFSGICVACKSEVSR